jgi:hypothetical protein
MRKFPGTSVVKIDNALDRIGVYRELNAFFGTYEVTRLRLVR